MKKVLIFEPDYSGHHLYYLSLIASVFDGRCQIIWGASKEAAQRAAEYYPDCVRRITETQPVPGEVNLFARLISVIKLLWYRHPQILFFPYGDKLVYFLPIIRFFYPFRNLSIQMILFRGKFCPSVYPSVLGVIKKTFFRIYLKLNFVQKIFIVDDLTFTSLKAEGLSAPKVVFLPDPMPNWQLIPKLEARQYLGLNVNIKYILSFGSLSSRKGVKELVEMVQNKVLPERSCLLLVGRPDKEMAQLIQNARNNINGFDERVILKTEFVSENDVAYFFAASDIVLANYLNHVGPSGVILKAFAMNRTVIGPDFGWVGWAIRQINSKWVYEHGSARSFQEKLISMMALTQIDFDAVACNDFKRNRLESDFKEVLKENFQ